MIITQEEVVNRQTVLHIELDAAEVDPYLDRGYRRVVPRLSIPGFRKGKAPRSIVERFVGRESLLNEVIDSMVFEMTDRAITERELEAAALPKIEIVGIDPVSLKATVPLKPEVELGDYRSMRVPVEPVEVTDEDVESALGRVQTDMSTWEPVERPAQMGDTVTISAVGKAEGETLLEVEDVVYMMDGELSMPVPGFAEKLVGIARDERREFTLAVPDDFHAPEAAGKEASFSVSASEVKERVVPSLDDDFAQSYGPGYETLDELRSKIAEDLRADAERRAEEQHRQACIEALMESAALELPPLMVEHEVDHMERERAQVLERANVRSDDYLRSIGKTEDEVRREMEEAAVERLSRSFALTRVAELEEVEVSDGEVDERVESLLAQSGQQPDEQQISDEMKGSIRRMLLSEKTLERLTAIGRGEDEAGPEEAGQTDSDPIKEELPDDRKA